MNSRSKRLVDVSASELETDVRWGLVRRILESQQFAKSARLHDFLLYVCRCALENRSDEISEHTIGERVFERASDYNPNEDNIVRSQARLLRQKLDAYFVSEGAGEPLLLRIPKGGYCPEFIERCEVESGPERAVLHSAKRSEWRTPLVGGLLVAIAALVLVTGVLAWFSREPGSRRHPGPGLCVLIGRRLIVVTTIRAEHDNHCNSS